MAKVEFEPAIIVEGLSKSFKLPTENHSGIKQLLLSRAKRKKSGARFIKQQVLDNVSFTVNKGDFFGIVGRNGSGKSTLLKLLAGIYVPDKGGVAVNGSLTPFIELGVGFNPELTGRENIYLNGALLGFSHEEMEKMYDEIVSFAELEKFMDQKLKNYSSGMQVRLAFSIAIRAKSDILILDEVLAVGDAAFQQKCNDYFEKQKASGQTIVLVTHDMASVEKYCTRAILIEDGEIVLDGSPEEVAARYTKANQLSIERQIEKDNDTNSHDGIEYRLTDKDGRTVNSITMGENINLVLSWKGNGVQNIGIALNKQSGERMFKTNTENDKITISGNTVTVSMKMNVAPGKYNLRIRLYGRNDLETVAMIENGPVVMVKPDSKKKFAGLIYIEHDWK